MASRIGQLTPNPWSKDNDDVEHKHYFLHYQFIEKHYFDKYFTCYITSNKPFMVGNA